MTWLAGTPQVVVEAHLEMLNRIKAEEAMSAATETLIGMRGLKPGGWVPRQWRAWQHAAADGARAIKATATDLRGIGVGVRVVKRGKANG